MKKSISIFVILLALCVNSSYSQRDSLNKDMKFDFGLTRDDNINMWPIFQYYNSDSLQRKKISILFPIYRYSRDYKIHKKYSHLLPFYLADSTASTRDLRLLSLYYPSLIHWHKDTTNDLRQFSIMEFAPHINFFEYARNRNGSFVRNNLFFFIWHKNDQILQKSHFIVFPLYWNFSSPDKKTNTLFPLYSYGKFNAQKDKYLALTPLFWKFSKTTEKSSLLFPFYWHKKSGLQDSSNFRNTTYIFPTYWSYKDKDYTDRIFFPFVWKHHNPWYNSFTLFPIYSHGYNKEEKSKHLAVTPLYWNLQNRYHKIQFIVPIWMKRELHVANDTFKTQLILPFYASYKSKYYRLNTFMPFFSKGTASDSSSNHLAITPLFWKFTKNRNYSYHLFPIWTYKKKFLPNGVYTRNVIFPLYFSTKSPDLQKTVFFPILWKSKNKNYESVTIMPLFSKGMATDSSFKHLAVTPLYWRFTYQQSMHQFIFPIWWYNERTQGENQYKSNLILPLYYSYKTKNKKTKIVAPFVYYHKNPNYKSLTVMPFFSKGNSPDYKNKHLAVTPLYWHFKSEYTHKNMLLPLWFNKKSYFSDDTTIRNIVLPLFYSYKNKYRRNYLFLPIIWGYKNRKYQSFTFFPFFSSGSSSYKGKRHLMVTPLFWHFKKYDKKHTFLLPLLWVNKSGKKDKIKKTVVFFPLYYAHKFKDKNNKVFFPIIWSFKSNKYQSFTFAPLFSQGKSTNKEYSHLMVTPLIWNFKSPKNKFKTVIPFFASTKKENFNKFNVLFLLYRYKQEKTYKQHDFIWPICEYSKDIDYKYFRFFPLIWSKKSPKNSYFTFQPFYYVRKSTDHENHLILWQLFTYQNYYNNYKSYNFLWKTLYWNNYSNNDHEFRFLYLLFADIKRQGEVTKSFFPFYYFTKDDSGNRSLSVLLYFYNKFKRKIPNSNKYYQEERIFWFIRLRSNYRSLKNQGLID